MANVLLGVTGSVAAIKIPELYEALKADGHQVRIVATRASLYFFDPAELDPVDDRRNPEVVVLDEDEWPGSDGGRRYQRGDAVLHIELRRWADLFLVAPLDANTLAKMAGGLADNCLTCVWRAWDLSRPVVMAPAMNTLMWEHPVTARHVRQLGADLGETPPECMPVGEVIAWINSHCRVLAIVPPDSRTLACGDVGIGALAPVRQIVEVVRSSLASGGAI